jgi:4-hydroxy-2-oxoheptanedioate aldolase
MQAFKDRLAKGPQLGVFCTLGSVDAVELACQAGFDFILIDAQHGLFDQAGLREAIRAVEAAGGFPVVRLPANGLSWVEGILDAGCPALLAPMVNSPEEAARLVAACHYPPLGQRSLAGCRASLRDSGYRQSFNGRFCLIVMIEHVSAIPHVAAMAALPGVGAFFIGPSDLASSLDPQGPGAPALEDAIESIRAACELAGKPVGLMVGKAEDAKARASKGFSFLAVGTDRRSLSDAFDKTVSAWRASQKP